MTGSIPLSPVLNEVKADSISDLLDRDERTPEQRKMIVLWLRAQRLNLEKAQVEKPKKVEKKPSTDLSIDELGL